MPELEEAPQDYLGYRDEDIFDESMIRTITPPPIQRNQTLPPPINRATVLTSDNERPMVSSQEWFNRMHSPNSVRSRIMTAVMGLTDDEIHQNKLSALHYIDNFIYFKRNLENIT